MNNTSACLSHLRLNVHSSPLIISWIILRHRIILIIISIVSSDWIRHTLILRNLPYLVLIVVGVQIIYLILLLTRRRWTWRLLIKIMFRLLLRFNLLGLEPLIVVFIILRFTSLISFLLVFIDYFGFFIILATFGIPPPSLLFFLLSPSFFLKIITTILPLRSDLIINWPLGILGQNSRHLLIKLHFYLLLGVINFLAIERLSFLPFYQEEISENCLEQLRSIILFDLFKSPSMFFLVVHHMY